MEGDQIVEKDSWLAYDIQMEGTGVDLQCSKTSDDYSTTVLRDFCRALGVPYFETSLRLMDQAPTGNVCSICARLKRGAAAKALAERWTLWSSRNAIVDACLAWQ